MGPFENNPQRTLLLFLVLHLALQARNRVSDNLFTKTPQLTQ